VQGASRRGDPNRSVKEERERIEAELYDAEKQLLETAVDWDTIETNLTLAMGLVSDCQQAYRRVGHECGGATTRPSGRRSTSTPMGSATAGWQHRSIRCYHQTSRNALKQQKTPTHIDVVGV
jgi:hypothetical protein